MIQLVIGQRRRDLGGFEVGRVLPFARRRMVGPFIFFDHMGPITFPPGIPHKVDVRPHDALQYLLLGGGQADVLVNRMRRRDPNQRTRNARDVD